MKRLLLVFGLFFTLTLFGQRYTNSIGLKFASLGSTQINGKHFLNENNALEVSLGGNTSYVWMQGNFVWQNALMDGLDYYVGAGPGFGINSRNPIIQTSLNNRFMFGVNGVLGIEDKLPDYPFTFSLESGPYVQINPNFSLGWNVGLAARYVLP